MTNDDKALVTTGFVMAPTLVKQRMGEIDQYRAIMREGEDYGTIPGTPKPTLYQSGADTLCIAAGLGAGEPVIEKSVEDWEFGFFFYLVKQPLIDQGGNIVAWGIGSCSSKEDKYAWRWIPVWKLTEEDKKRAETEGWHREWRVSKGKRYLMYRMPNPDPYSQANTILKMATKRAYVSATLRATGAQRVFTQDVEDLPTNGSPAIEGEFEEVEESPVSQTAPATPKAAPASGPMGEWESAKCPTHGEGWVLKKGQYGDWWGCPHVSQLAGGKKGYCKEKPAPRRVARSTQEPMPEPEPEYQPPEEEGMLEE